MEKIGGYNLVEIDSTKINDTEYVRVATKDIPRLTRTIHCCDNLENLKCVNGDLIELKKDGSDIYFVYSNYEFHRLTIAQVLELENKYSMRIMF